MKMNDRIVLGNLANLQTILDSDWLKTRHTSNPSLLRKHGVLTERDKFDESLANLQVGVFFFFKKELQDFIVNYFVTDLNKSDNHTDSETEMAACQRAEASQEGEMCVSIVSIRQWRNKTS